MVRPILGLVLLSLLVLWVQPAVGDDDDGQFRLFGNGSKVADPETPFNQVIRVNTSLPPTFGGAVRNLNVKVDRLDNQLSVKYYFVSPHTCGVGTPRLFLVIDTDGDGMPNGNAFGYIGPSPSFTGCVTNAWQFEDLSDAELEWDITQLGGPFYNTWDEVEVFFSGFPLHKVLRGGLVHDTSNPATGILYFDLLTVGNATLENWEDIDDD